MAPRRWLQRELQVRLLLPVLGLVVVTAILSAFGAQRLVERAFDHWLMDAAQSLARQVQFDAGRASVSLSEQSIALLTFDEIDSTRFELEQDGHRLAGASTFDTRGEGERHFASGARAFDARLEGRPVRVAEVLARDPKGATASVRVSETMEKRNRARRDLLFALAPVAVLVVAATVMLGMLLRRTIAPLQDIANRWNARSHASLEEIPAHDVPRELLPFALALNDLLARVRQMLERERSFAATAAHQLRTPLAGLQLGLARAARAPDLAATREVIADLGASTQRMARLVNQLLALSRLDPEIKSDLHWSSVDLVSLAQDAGQAYLDAAQAKHIELRLQVDLPADTRITIRGQPDLLLEAIGHLLDNAIQYTPVGGTVTITVDQDPPSIAVSDTGPGVPAEDQQRVFERFQRGSDAKGEGSGLGLAIVREIAALHGARSLLYPEAGGGSCVQLRFETHEAAA